MKRTPLLAFLAFLMAVASVHPLTAQSGELNDETAGAAQLFGQGNGIRGVVTAAASGNFMIRTDENESYKVFYSPNTHAMKDRQPIGIEDIRSGDMLFAAGEVDRKAKTVGAVFLYDIDAAEVRKAREGFGKTWTAGKVKAIHDLKIVIERAGDRQTQIVAVDENTSFRRHNEDVTLGEVGIGDFISAQGALQNNIFLAKTLRVLGPKAGDPVPPEGPPGQ